MSEDSGKKVSKKRLNCEQRKAQRVLRKENKRKSQNLVGKIEPEFTYEQIIEFEPIQKETDNYKHFGNKVVWCTKYIDKTQIHARDGYKAIGYKDLTIDQLHKLHERMEAYGVNTISYWSGQKVGATVSTLYKFYDDFPKHSRFKWPSVLIPKDAVWGRFHIGQTFRLVGFTCPAELHGFPLKNATGCFLNKNEFNIVWYDAYHDFWPSKK